MGLKGLIWGSGGSTYNPLETKIRRTKAGFCGGGDETQVKKQEVGHVAGVGDPGDNEGEGGKKAKRT